MEFFFDPLCTFVACSLLAAAIWKWWRKRVGVIVFCFGVLWFVLFVITPLPIWLCACYERSVTAYPMTDPRMKDAQIPVLSLGGGISDDPHLVDSDRLTPASRARLIRSVSIYRLAPGRKIIFSGSSTFAALDNADVTAQAALDVGVDPADTLKLKHCYTTREEAREFAKRFGKRPFFLVTDAIHMPRALQSFRALGLKPMPVPCNYLVQFGQKSNPYHWKPDFAKAMVTKRLFHEYAGTLYYKWRQ